MNKGYRMLCKINIKKPLEKMNVSWLAKQCGCSEDFLWMLARDTTIMYKPTREQLKRDGNGSRYIDPPKPQYKGILKKIAKIISSNMVFHPAAHGGVSGRSSFSSAKPHCGAKFIITRDIENCYPSISTKQLCKAFINIGASSTFAQFLSSIVTVHDYIPQGGPASSLALNLFFLRMDDHFYIKTKVKKGAYRRFADDFVISTKTRKEAINHEKELDYSIKHRNLKINEKKRKEKGLLAGDKLKDIHSLIINSRRGVKPKKEHIQKGLELAERYARCCRCAKPSDLLYLAELRQRTAGMMYYFRQAHFSPAKHIKTIIERADKKVLFMLIKRGLQPHKNKWWLIHTGKNEPQRLMHLWENEIKLRYSA